MPPPGAAAGPPASAFGAAPNAPNSTLPSERFIAVAINIVSSVPDAPTSVPLMMSTVLSSAKPVTATATPVNELSSEITTGMSAPPIGNTPSTPSNNAATTIPTNAAAETWPSSMNAERPTTASNTSALTNCWPAYVIGRPVMSSCSFANATRLPEKLTEPMIELRMIGKS